MSFKDHDRRYEMDMQTLTEQKKSFQKYFFYNFNLFYAFPRSHHKSNYVQPIATSVMKTGMKTIL
ncbi:CLUMA_CG005799, isoform A [Clunio marinus]|uniref:CLUMA_CG005799, isoform A n=1 Tax=Clunio marinus TaxID=568069 RepID=A0A1J1HW32_9DIPT|nr:CLUMA_CG005799, isoform A [Clunio marinus]